MADIQCDLGEKTTCELVAQYGEGTAVFQHCDNTKDEDVKGENSTWPPLMSAPCEFKHTIFPNSIFFCPNMLVYMLFLMINNTK